MSIVTDAVMKKLANVSMNKKAEEVVAEKPEEEAKDQAVTTPTELLKRLLATEYQAITMYNCAYYKLRGKERLDLIPEYEAHKEEEEEHAKDLEELMLELGGITFSNADEWKEYSPTEVPSIDTAVVDAINAVIEKSEEEAVALYTAAVEYFKGIDDEATASKLKKILKDEREHLKDVRIDFQGKDSAV